PASAVRCPSCSPPLPRRGACPQGNAPFARCVTLLHPRPWNPPDAAHRLRARRRVRRTQPVAEARRPLRQRRRRQGAGRVGPGARGWRAGIAQDRQDPCRSVGGHRRRRGARTRRCRRMTGVAVATLVAVVLLAAWGVSAYNRLVRLRNQVATAWSDIDVQLQRRHDLVPQLVAAVQGYAAHESATLEAVTALRTRALGLQDPA